MPYEETFKALSSLQLVPLYIILIAGLAYLIHYIVKEQDKKLDKLSEVIGKNSLANEHQAIATESASESSRSLSEVCKGVAEGQKEIIKMISDNSTTLAVHSDRAAYIQGDVKYIRENMTTKSELQNMIEGRLNDVNH